MMSFCLFCTSAELSLLLELLKDFGDILTIHETKSFVLLLDWRERDNPLEEIAEFKLVGISDLCKLFLSNLPEKSSYK